VEHIAKVLQGILQTFLEWLDTIFHPYLTCGLITAQLSSRDKLDKSLRIWIASYFLAFIVQLPLYRVVGIDWKYLTFLLPHTLSILFMLIICGSLFHIALKLRGIHSDLTDTMAIYTVVAGAFAPLMSIITYPSSAIFLVTMRRVKHAKLSLNETVSSIFTALSNTPPDLVYVNYIKEGIGTPLFVVSSLSMAMLVSLVYRDYGCAKYRVVCSLSLMILFGFIPLILFVILDDFCLFVAIS
jgi:hypothetical protein